MKRKEVKLSMTRQEMIDVLVERQIDFWIDGGNGEEELEGILLYGWKGYEKYTKEELKCQIEGEGLEQNEIEEHLAGSRSRREKRIKYQDDRSNGVEEEMPF